MARPNCTELGLWRGPCAHRRKWHWLRARAQHTFREIYSSGPGWAKRNQCACAPLRSDLATDWGLGEQSLRIQKARSTTLMGLTIPLLDWKLRCRSVTSATKTFAKSNGAQFGPREPRKARLSVLPIQTTGTRVGA